MTKIQAGKISTKPFVIGESWTRHNKIISKTNHKSIWNKKNIKNGISKINFALRPAISPITWEFVRISNTALCGIMRNRNVIQRTRRCKKSISRVSLKIISKFGPLNSSRKKWPWVLKGRKRSQFYSVAFIPNHFCHKEIFCHEFSQIFEATTAFF